MLFIFGSAGSLLLPRFSSNCGQSSHSLAVVRVWGLLIAVASPGTAGSGLARSSLASRAQA